MIEILCHAERDGVLLEVVGDLSAATAATLRTCLEATLSADVDEVAIDLRSVPAMDDAVADTLLEHARLRARRGGRLALRNVPSSLLGIPAIAELHRLATAVDGAAPALGDVGSKPCSSLRSEPAHGLAS